MVQGEIRGLPKQLTRLTKSGKAYSRPPEVEAQLRSLLQASDHEQLLRAKVDKRSPQFVKDECLVYLIHEAWLVDDSSRFSDLTGQLLGRCAPSIRRSLHAIGVPVADREELYDQIITAMITAILSHNGAGEFFQVRFRRAMRFLIIKLHAQYARRRERTQGEVSLSETIAGDEDGEDGATLEERIAAREDVSRDAEQRMIIREALAAIRDPRHRQAFVLHHYDDWPLESSDPDVPSISRHFGVTDRTLRTWLRAAERDLAVWRETQGA